MRAPCPHCGTSAAIRSSKRITPLYSEVRFECPNEDCGHVWLASLGVLHTLYPSNTPNPDVQIPVATVPSRTAAATSAAG
jgi:predicted RNA-binding Zn-ribbon protein involved in translation (DUF1610 family)